MLDKLYILLNKKLQLRFEDEEKEKKFRKEYVKDSLKQNKFAVWVTLLAYSLYIPIGKFLTPEDFTYDLILMLTIPITSSVFMLLYLDKIKKNHSLILFFYSISIAIPPIISIFYTKRYYKIYLNNYILVMIGIMVIYGAFFLITFLSLLIVNIIATIALTINLHGNSELVYNIFFIKIAFVVTSIASYLIEKSKRKIYSDKYKMEEQDKFIQQQAKLAQMGEMMSMIAHQWRQPLASINSNIAGINNKIEAGKFNLCDKDSQEEFLDFLKRKHQRIIKYTQHLSDTIDVFRTFYKPDKEKKNVSIVSPIENTLKIIETSLNNSGIELIKKFNTNENILIYNNELMQVLSNILKNSKDNFIEKNIKNRIITMETERKDNNIIIKISDTGGGIPQEIINKIFDPYFSTKDEKNGTGLGLYMSKTIIEKHHKGRLEVKNIKNGVCFEIILPMGGNNV